VHKINKDNIDRFFENGVHFETRIIHIGRPDETEESGHNISFHTASEVIKAITMLEGASTAPITINLMSYGGDVYAALAIYDIITACRCEVSIKGMGAIMSGGAIIMQAAAEGNRFIYPNAHMMLHDGEDGFHGHARDFERWADHGKKMRTQVYKIFADKCGETSSGSHKANWWRKRMDRDWILTAEEAVNYNIVDEIIKRNFK